MIEILKASHQRARLAIAVARPPVLLLLVMYAATGLAAAGGDLNNPLHVGPVLAVVAGFLVYSVCLNDIADLEIDRVNLASRDDRPLVTGAARGRQLVAIAGGAALVALGASSLFGWRALTVCATGLAISAAYSLRPIRLAQRGAVASLMLPGCYVAVPYLTGLFATSSTVGTANLVLLAALYVGFIGRILLKDFRDVRGDALFGKRTFLVRHGRKATCVFSAVGWIAGTGLTLYAMAIRGDLPGGLVASYSAALVAVLALLWALSIDRGPRRDELIVSTLAIVGRGQLVVVLVALAMRDRPAPLVSGAIGALAIIITTQAYQMLRRGPVMRHTVPDAWLESGRIRSSSLPVRFRDGSQLHHFSILPKGADHVHLGSGRSDQVQDSVGGSDELCLVD